ncbi:MAG: DUF4389 domain-containing protein [Lysobacterales bacterium]
MPQTDSSDSQTASPEAQPTEPPWANTDIWLRVLTTLVYGVIFWLSLWLLGLAVIINLVMLVATGNPNRSVVGFAQQLARYQRQIIAYATLDSDEAPFPFGEPLGSSSPLAGNAPDNDSKTSEPSANRKPAPSGKKTAKKKAASRKKKTRSRVQSGSKNEATADADTGSEDTTSNQTMPQNAGSET